VDSTSAFRYASKLVMVVMAETSSVLFIHVYILLSCTGNTRGYGYLFSFKVNDVNQ